MNPDATDFDYISQMQPVLVAYRKCNPFWLHISEFLIIFAVKLETMKIGAIITGDIVDSTKMNADERNAMLQMLQTLPGSLSPITSIILEIFRGDSFQIRVDDIPQSLRIAIAIRAYLRTYQFAESRQQWDARLSIGIGTLDFEEDTIACSDGEAYRLSGRGLDYIGASRLVIRTPWPEVNDELHVSTAFADNVISSWTPSQSRVFFQKLTYAYGHAEIGNILGISRQMVDKALRTGKGELLNLYLNRFEELMITNLP